MIHSFRNIALFLTLAAGVMGLQAKEISPSQALQLFKSGQSSQQAPSRVRNMAASPVLSHTFTAQGRNTAYVFNQPGQGFVILAADDEVAPVIGYVEGQEFDPVRIPANMAAFMQILGNELSRGQAPQRALSNTTPHRARIAPLVKTLWNQSAPFNNKCPQIGGKQTYTGCVATAMAMMMKFYNYPEKGIGSKTYVPEDSNTGDSYSADFEGTTYDWDNMLDDYYCDYTDEQADAVATLMYHCGVAASMMYGTSSSGAYTSEAMRGMAQYFGYDKSMYMADRDCYTLLEFNNLVYNELAMGRPVMMAGGQHQYICDGYDANDYFHINWGWGGSYDGYFKLTLLQPQSSGIGGFTDNYSENLEVTLNLIPDQGTQEFTKVMKMYGDFTAQKTDYPRTSRTDIAIGSNSSYYMNQSFDAIENAYIGFKLVDTTDPTNIKYVKAGKISYLYSMDGFTSYKCATTSLPVGTWKVTQYFVVGDGDPIDVKAQVGARDELTFEVTANRVTIIGNDVNPVDLKITDLTPAGKFYAGGKAKINAKVQNDGTKEYDGMVAIGLKNADGDVYISQEIPLAVPAGENGDMSFIAISFKDTDSNTAPDGTYQMWIIDPDTYEILSDEGSLTIQKAANDPKLSVTNMEFTDALSGDGTYENPYIINSDCDVNFTATIKCTWGVFNDFFNFSVYKMVPDGDSYYYGDRLAILSTDFLMLARTNVATCPMTARVYDATEDDIFQIIDNNTVDMAAPVSQFFMLNMDSSTAIDDISANEAPAQYFDLSGRRVLEPVAGTIYIKKQGSKVTKAIL